MNVRLVIVLVGTALLAALAGIVVLAVTDHPIPDVLQNVAVGCLTGLVGLLAPNQSARVDEDNDPA